MDGALEFVVAAADPRERTDKLIVYLLARAGRPSSRAEVHRWLAEGRVLIDGEVARRARAVAPGARVVVRPGPPPPSNAHPDPTVPFRVVHEDAALLVVDKPAGIVVHPARGHREGTLVHGLLAHRARAAGESPEQALPSDPRDPEGHLRPGIVHRLDKGTSGLMVVAKTPQAREALKEQFARHSLERAYLAIAVGRTEAATYDTPYGRHPRSRLRYTSRLPAGRPAARRAVTHVEPTERLPTVTVVRCRLETGRTHQIRVHLAEQARTPVLGDPLYGGSPPPGLLRELALSLGHQALHAAVLGFTHPTTGRSVRWESPPPADFAEALVRLRGAVTTPST